MMPPYNFDMFHEEMTPEERKALKDKVDAEKADWMKKNKKKPKSADEEANDHIALKTKMMEQLAIRCVHHDSVIGWVEDHVAVWIFNEQLKSHEVMNTDAWDEIYWKYSILDIPCEGKNVLVRLDLDVPLSEYTPPSLDENPEDEEAKLNKSQLSGKQPGGTGRSKGKETQWSKTTSKTVETIKSKSKGKSEIDGDTS